MAPARRVREGLSAFVAASAGLFAAGAATTIAWCTAMPVICGSKAWPGGAASFLAMWTVMMVPMMMPSLAPALWRYRQALAREAAKKWLGPVALAAAGYFFVWALLGLAAYPLGALFFAKGTRTAVAIAVIVAGLVQFSSWKLRHLACCRDVAHFNVPWLHGMHLGVRCGLACGNLMAIVVVAGVMDLATMAAVAAVITLERIAPCGKRAAQGVGWVALAAGLLLLARA